MMKNLKVKCLIKKFIILIYTECYNFFLKIFYLSELDDDELNGEIKKYTLLKLGRKARQELSFSNGLTIRGISFHDRQNDAFNKALNKFDPDCHHFGIDDKHFECVINKSYEFDKVKSIKDFNNIFSHTPLEDYPIWCFVYPWEHVSMELKRAEYLEMVKFNRNEYLENDTVNHKWFIKSHLNQFLKIIKSLTENGFIKSKKPPKVIVLINGKQWKWIMSGEGNHRAYAANFIGIKRIQFQIDYVVNLNDFDSPPNRPGAESYDKQSLYKLYALLKEENLEPLRGIL